jgi:hypothetical protein
MGIEIIIISVLFTHFVADFIIQTDYQAKNKSKCFMALTEHIVTYMLTSILAMIIFALAAGLSVQRAIAFCVINGALHLVVDAITSRYNARKWAEGMAQGSLRGFFIGVGFDQFIHTACLVSTVNLLAV